MIARKRARSSAAQSSAGDDFDRTEVYASAPKVVAAEAVKTTNVTAAERMVKKAVIETST
jgi:hypothetical protein